MVMATPSAASPSSSSSSPSSTAVGEHQRQQQQEEQLQQQQQHHHHQHHPNAKEKECVHKTKLIHFLGRTTPIVLQNDNGPCPLLAICNILLLRNTLNLSPDTTEVSQEKLLSLVADRLIDSNSNVNNKDAGYVENQQQNIADAIDLLPRLATGIDVNIKFRRIDDFEFTPECAIFDLLDIPLYHGWIVDPQDYDTANAIGSKSYNALMGELVILETRLMDKEHKHGSEEDCVDFAAATTAALGVPSPSLSKVSSFDGSPCSASDGHSMRKGDLEEKAELLRVLKLSEAEIPNLSRDSVEPGSGTYDHSYNLAEGTSPQKIMHPETVSRSEDSTGVGSTYFPSEPSFPSAAISPTNEKNPVDAGTYLGEVNSSFSKTDDANQLDQLKFEGTVKVTCGNDLIDMSDVNTLGHVEDAAFLSPIKYSGFVNEDFRGSSLESLKLVDPASSAYTDEVANHQSGCDAQLSNSSMAMDSLDSSGGKLQQTDAVGAFTPSIDGSEPLYEGEERILDSGTTACEDREPVYEGEVVLAKQADNGTLDAHNVSCKDEISPQQGELIRNFLRTSASQLTIYGLFCLQDGLKERELCVFFRNNHFSTMFKYEGQLYLLATDQGYLNQPDLVWEKLNEVNGDTLFMTSNFKEFKVESHTNDAWDEHNAMTSTADYLASIDSARHAGLDMNSDLQLAIALQQQEFEQQQPQRNNVQQQAVGGSRLVTGPQVGRYGGRNTSSSSRADPKSKERCSIM